MSFSLTSLSHLFPIIPTFQYSIIPLFQNFSSSVDLGKGYPVAVLDVESAPGNDLLGGLQPGYDLYKIIEDASRCNRSPSCNLSVHNEKISLLRRDVPVEERGPGDFQNP